MSKKTKFKLPKSTKTKWVKALKELSDKQISSTLCEDGAYCATGALAKAYGVTDDEMESADMPNIMYLPREAARKLPNCFRAKKNGNGEPEAIDKTAEAFLDKIMTWNDDAMWSFNKIASHINRYY